jgi:predicted TIM-barrel fold metal-dependent hydrolase
MKTKVLSFIIWILSIAQCFGQVNTYKLSVIDMHLHVYSNESYWVGDDLPVFPNKVLTSPKTSNVHIKAVMDQMVKNNIVLSYASGNFEALDSLNVKYPGKFFPSIEIWPTRELLGNAKFLETLKLKIAKGEIKGIGEVLNFYYGIAPNDPVMDTLYKIAVKYDLPIGIHFGLSAPGSQLNEFPKMLLNMEIL